MDDEPIMDPRAEHADAPKQDPRSDLWAIVYVSKAARPVTQGDLVELLEGARRRNAKEDITGVLLCADGSFMQYLEGPAAGLLRVYAIIKAHPLHYGLIDLVREPILTREFAEWSMACHVCGAGGEPLLSEHYDLLASRMAAAVRAKSAARELLSGFWAAGRHSVPPDLLSPGHAGSLRRLPASLDTGPAR